MADKIGEKVSRIAKSNGRMMMDRQDLKWIGLFLVLGILGVGTFVRYYDRAFPIASLNFKLTRSEANEKAEAYVRAMGYDTRTYQSAQVLDSAGLQQVYLERTLGLEKANQLARDWVSIWYWHIRWFKSLEKEELRLRMDPGGRVVGFEHRMLESDPGASLNQGAALGLAETYLTQTQGIVDLSYYQINGWLLLVAGLLPLLMAFLAWRKTPEPA
ncbi:MAG: hypothetical protein O3B73_03640 [bacterium]|nr:hypothetical protein [bacterium]